MVQAPAVWKISAPLVISHTASVAASAENATTRPELAVAASVSVAFRRWLAGWAKVMVWPILGVTLFDAAEAAPVPTLLVAVTVKV